MAVSGTGVWPLRSPRANLPPWHRKQLLFGRESSRATLVNDLFFGTPAAGGTTGTVASTLAGVTSAAAGSPVGAGAAASTLAGVTQAASGTPVVSGAASPAMAGATAAANGTSVVRGTLVVTLAGVTCVAAGTAGPTLPLVAQDFRLPVMTTTHAGTSPRMLTTPRRRSR